VAGLVAGLVERLADGLPATGPVVARLLVAQVDVVARSVEGHAILAEAANAAVLGGLIEG